MNNQFRDILRYNYRCSHFHVAFFTGSDFRVWVVSMNDFSSLKFPVSPRLIYPGGTYSGETPCLYSGSSDDFEKYCCDWLVRNLLKA